MTMRDYAVMIKALRWCDDVGKCSECPEDFGCAEKNGSVMREAADAIEELVAERDQFRGQAKMVPHWISVEERLPHYLDHVLCVNKYGIQMVGYLTDYKEGGFRCESGMDSCDYITHWMQLPKAPKEVV